MNSITTHRPRLRESRNLAATLAIAMLCASCTLSRPAPVKSTFLLEAAAPAVASAPRNSTLRMGQIGVAAPFRDKSFVMRKGEVAYESDFYNTFFVSPSAMLTEATAKALSGAGIFRRTIPPGLVSDDGDFVLEGFASELYGDARASGAPAAVLTITFYLSVADATPVNVFWSKEYRQRVVAADASAEALAKAWNSALAATLADLARDLAVVPLPKRSE